MGECHYCFNCGRCRGETPPAVYARTCPACLFKNEAGSKACAKCGESLLMDPTRVYRKPSQRA
ncbi:MAG: hypothetical protein HFJ73_06450 [Eggerthellaceae bacterium]|jgi:hypothetical protein|nr:hypothetical protein [Eggerthellaceae bacterium]